MKQIFFKLIVYCLLNTIVFQSIAQQKNYIPCYSDELLKKQITDNPNLITVIESNEQKINDFKNQTQTRTASYIIPIVVHIVHNGEPLGTGSNVSDAQIQSQIDALNRDFANAYPSGSQGVYAVNTNITFCLAQNRPDGSGGYSSSWSSINGTGKQGITRTLNTTISNHQMGDIALPNLIKFPQNQYLNIWVVSTITDPQNPVSGTIAGYSPFPIIQGWQALDGIVMDRRFFGDKSATGGSFFDLPFVGADLGKILSHEAGHYLYLWHTFQGGCAGTEVAGSGTDACDKYGDYVCDTPPIQLDPSQLSCSSVASICSGNIPYLREDFMDYTDDNCRNTFTAGQTIRMNNSLALFRSNIYSSSNLTTVGAGVNCTGNISASFNVSPSSNGCVNQLLNFSAIGAGVSTYLWDFGDGTTSTTNFATHSYTNKGIYKVTLTVSDGINNVSETQDIFITECNLRKPQQAFWAFGYDVGLNFINGTAVGITPNLESLEASASVCDNSGNLLFYTDGINVWNKNGSIMPTNISNQLNGSPNSRNKFDQYASSSQGALIVPNPASANQFYIFTTSDIPHFGSVNNGLCFTIVDMSLDGGLGDIILSTLNTPAPIIPGKGLIKICEGQVAIPDCDNGYWIIVHGSGENSYFGSKLLSYHLTTSGLSAPVESASYTSLLSTSWPAVYGWGQMDASPDGKLLAIVPGRVNEQVDKMATGTFIYTFDNSTGLLSLLKTLPEGEYGISFSPQSKFLYLLDNLNDKGNIIRSALLYQYDVASLYTSTPVKYSMNSLYTEFVQLQAGPDDKIYLAQRNSNRLAVINFPENKASSINPNAFGYNYYGPQLTSNKCLAGLPNMIDAMPPNMQPLDFTYTIKNCSSVYFDTKNCLTDVLWSFGDNTNSTIINPSHIYPEGTYSVSLTSGVNTLTKEIKIGVDLPNISGQQCVIISATKPYSYSISNYNPNLIYDWTVDNNGTVSNLTNRSSVDVLWIGIGGSVTVTVKNSLTGCTKTSVINVGVCQGVDEQNSESIVIKVTSPEKSELSISFENANNSKTVRLINTLGQEIYFSKTTENKIEIKNISIGFYIIMIETSGKLYTTKQVVR